MNVLLINSKIKGIKNIDKEISISYSKKNFDAKAFEQSYIKTIYGSNGSGKSGIVHAYDIYNFIVTNEFPFKDQIFVSKLLKLINKKTNEFSIENVFAVNLDEKINRYEHKLIISIDDNKNIYISNESLFCLNSRLDVSQCIFEVVNGEIIKNDNIYFDELNSQLNKQNSVIQSLIKNTLLNNPFENDIKRAIALTYYFAISLDVSFGSADDEHESVNLKSIFEHIKDKDFFKTVSSTQYLSSTVHKMKGDRYAWVIRTEDEKKYANLTKRLYKFLKLLTPALKDIKVNFKHDGSFSYCELKFIYKGYDVDYEFESTGIKKLCSLFISLSQIEDNQIVIIDEIDAGIHDVFLTALIEYFALYSHCQIIITTHHVGLMDVVKHISKSISILTDDHKIKAWVKDGDLSPSSLYKKGYLEGVPFNLKPFDFAEIFSTGKK